MVQVTNAFDTYEAIGIREDLADIIYNVDPTETPFVSGVPRTTATNTNHEWQTDTLAAAAQNAQLEGDTISRAVSAATTRLNNRTQISYKDSTVTGTQMAVTTAGRADELNYQMSKRALELRRDMENDALANNAKAVGSATVARESAGIEAWLGTNSSRGTTGADPSPIDGTAAATDGTARAFTETLLDSVTEDIFTSGGDPNMLMVGPFNKQTVSDFGGRASTRQMISERTILAAADLYAGDFGTLQVMPNRFQRARSALVLQMDMWAIATLPGRNMMTFELSKIGDADTEVILTEWTLESRNERASGIVADLTTAAP